MSETSLDKNEEFSTTLMTRNDRMKNGVILDDGVDSHDDEIKFGVAGCQPRLFTKIGWFTAFFSVSSLITSSATTYVISQVTTLERQFGFSSKQTSLLMSASEIGFLVVVIFASYMANRVHIPRTLALTTVMFGVSCLICALPHFLFGHDDDLDDTVMTSDVSSNQSREEMFGHLCQFGNRSESDTCKHFGDSASDSPRDNRHVSFTSLTIIFIGMMLQGVCKGPRFSFSVTYIDNNTEKVKTGFHMGIIITVAIFGPAVAFVLGGVFTKIYVTLGETELDHRHSQWIGAWWLGYIFIGTIAFIVSLPLFFFPRRLPRKTADDEQNTQKEESTMFQSPSETIKQPSRKQKQDESHTAKIALRSRAVIHVKEFIRSMLRLWTNPIYMLMCLASWCFVFAIAGTSSYGPKYIERIFDLPAHTANYIMAAESLFATSLGTFIGGYLSKRWKLNAYSSLVMAVVVCFLSTVLDIPGFFFYCEQPEIYNTPWSNSSCSSECQCEDYTYFPVCGSDGRTYYSPCAAGCTIASDGTYFNCSCIEGGGESVSGMCSYSCPQVYYYAVIIGIHLLLGTMSIVPEVVIIIRSVQERDKPLAMGFISFSTSLLGFILGNATFGMVIDGICVIWDKKCDVIGRCLLYDNDAFRLTFNGFALSADVTFLAGLVTALVYAKCTGFLKDEKEESTSSAKGLQLQEQDSQTGFS